MEEIDSVPKLPSASGPPRPELMIGSNIQGGGKDENTTIFGASPAVSAAPSRQAVFASPSSSVGAVSYTHLTLPTTPYV